MTITIQEITDSGQWNGFLTSQPRGHLLQSYEWGELNRYLGGVFIAWAPWTMGAW